MKKIISALLIVIICMSSASVFAAEKMGYSKVFDDVDIRLTPVASPEAVLVVAQFKSGSLIDMSIIDVPQPDEIYMMPPIVIEDGIDYEFYVYDNILLQNELFESIKINSEMENKLYVDEYLDEFFKRIE